MANIKPKRSDPDHSDLKHLTSAPSHTQYTPPSGRRGMSSEAFLGRGNPAGQRGPHLQQFLMPAPMYIFVLLYLTPFSLNVSHGRFPTYLFGICEMERIPRGRGPVWTGSAPGRAPGSATCSLPNEKIKAIVFIL